MDRRPRNPRTGIFTRPVVTLMVAGGVWSTAINLGLFIGALNAGRNLHEAMGMVFISLVLVQFLKAFNFRSDRQSVFQRPFANRWLNLAVLWEVALLITIVYFPPLQGPFDTFALTPGDWLLVGALSATIMPVLELVKWMVRKGWLGTAEH